MGVAGPDMVPDGRDEVAEAIRVTAGMWMFDDQRRQWGCVTEACRGEADWAINAWRVTLRDVGVVWLDLFEPVTVRVPARVEDVALVAS